MVKDWHHKTHNKKNAQYNEEQKQNTIRFGEVLTFYSTCSFIITRCGKRAFVCRIQSHNIFVPIKWELGENEHSQMTWMFVTDSKHQTMYKAMKKINFHQFFAVWNEIKLFAQIFYIKNSGFFKYRPVSLGSKFKTAFSTKIWWVCGIKHSQQQKPFVQVLLPLDEETTTGAEQHHSIKLLIDKLFHAFAWHILLFFVVVYMIVYRNFKLRTEKCVRDKQKDSVGHTNTHTLHILDARLS